MNNDDDIEITSLELGDEKELIKRLNLKPHFENGLYAEVNFVNEKAKRKSSGTIYYYVRKNEKSRFHKIDSDEYWLYHLGSDLEIWIIYPNILSIK